MRRRVLGSGAGRESTSSRQKKITSSRQAKRHMHTHASDEWMSEWQDEPFVVNDNPNAV